MGRACEHGRGNDQKQSFPVTCYFVPKQTQGSFLRIFSALRFVAIRILSFSRSLSSPRFTLEAREEDDEPRVLGL